MTVRELIDALEEYDDEMQVCIGMIQTYGSNFAMDICDEVGVLPVNDWDAGDEDYVVLTEGRQFGTVKYDD